MSEPGRECRTSQPEPKLRHEFVGMMFAVAIGEVGLQTAALVQAGHALGFLPAWTHLLLATVVIATSWVGWTLSVAPGARRDVNGIFEWEFIVLLMDVLLVILYFILVRTVDFGNEQDAPRIAPAARVATLMLIIFALYLLWDVLTKVCIYWKYRDKSKKGLLEHYDSSWLRTFGVRMVPSTVCLILSCVTLWLVRKADAPHMLTADLAMIGLILLFRALKDFSSSFPKLETGGQLPPEKIGARNRAVRWMIPWSFLLLFGLIWTAYSLPLPCRMAAEIGQYSAAESHSTATGGHPMLGFAK